MEWLFQKRQQIALALIAAIEENAPKEDALRYIEQLKEWD